ncbi:hypothetical protein C9374_012878 [Naegleria lovaniensis]|uniref:DUF4116 domain-containing protein n=1 Tax=Naegleria lovaniensis TaxID=51637 RepID=A0AA88GCD0_NAELO|nr:uncharacterized protein C9374_012878 [Naegleria lovaniensis]KAG2373032.1 hypothetical protein C9374_012878 [Naegleria lovaniensis]
MIHGRSHRVPSANDETTPSLKLDACDLLAHRDLCCKINQFIHDEKDSIQHHPYSKYLQNSNYFQHNSLFIQLLQKQRTTSQDLVKLVFAKEEFIRRLKEKGKNREERMDSMQLARFLEQHPLPCNHDKTFMLEAIIDCHQCYLFQYASRKLQNDREFVLKIVSHFGPSLQFVSDALRNDREIALAAISERPYAFKFASQEWKNDREIVRAALTGKGSCIISLVECDESIQRDEEIMQLAVKRNGNSLSSALHCIKSSFPVVFQAVSQNGLALQYASLELRNDREIVLQAVSQNGFALEHASHELRNDREIIMKALSWNGTLLELASEELQSDFDIVMHAVKQNGHALQYASESLRNDERLKTKHPNMWDSL